MMRFAFRPIHVNQGRGPLSWLLCAAVLLTNLLLGMPTIAQTAAQATGKNSAQNSAQKPAQKSAQRPAQRPAQNPVSSSAAARLQAQANAEASAAKRATPKNVPTAAEGPVPEASADELAIAQQIHQGLLPCEMGASIRVEADTTQPGYFHVQGKGFRYRMFPVRTNTGALRLEDKKAGAVWLQLANKSMLMDEKKGRRVADECAHPDQVAFSEKMKTNPLPSLFD